MSDNNKYKRFDSKCQSQEEGVNVSLSLGLNLAMLCRSIGYVIRYKQTTTYKNKVTRCLTLLTRWIDGQM